MCKTLQNHQCPTLPAFVETRNHHAKRCKKVKNVAKKKGVKSRAVEDVKIHFQNWLSKKLENDKVYGNNEQKESDPRRGTEIQAASAEDYKHTV